MPDLRDLAKAFLDAQRKYHQGIEDTFKRDMIVHTTRHPHIPVRVIGAFGGRVQVYNPKTDTYYWVEAYRLIEHPRQQKERL